MLRSWVSLLAACCLLSAAEPADWIITAPYVVTMDEGRRVIENGAVAVRAERVVGVDTRPNIDQAFQAKQRLDRPATILAPGLINTHTHAPMSLLRGLADDLKLQEWLEKYIFPAEARNVSPEFVRWGTRLACLEMLLSGTTTYTDMYYFEEIIAETTKECGMRGVLGQTVIGFSVADAKTPDEGLKRAERFIERFEGDPLIVPAIAPHAVYTNSDETLRSARQIADRYRVPLLIHLSETKRENDEILKRRGITPTRLLERLGILKGRTLAAHAVWIDDQDMNILKESAVGIAHCPSSNMKLASGVAPVAKYLELDLPVGLGPDGPAGSNNDLSMFEEMDLAAKLQKVTTGDPTVLNAQQAFEMATIRGARALGMQDRIGSIERGKLADLITIRISEPHAIPMFDVYSHLVYVLKGSDVNDVMVNGRLIVRNRKVLTIDTGAVLKKAAEYGRAIQASLR
jgi:5-methylthioadenosine/S-adenosylhomocysteine deaminase